MHSSFKSIYFLIYWIMVCCRENYFFHLDSTAMIWCVIVISGRLVLGTSLDDNPKGDILGIVDIISFITAIMPIIDGLYVCPPSPSIELTLVSWKLFPIFQVGNRYNASYDFNRNKLSFRLKGWGQEIWTKIELLSVWFSYFVRISICFYDLFLEFLVTFFVLQN